MIFRISVRRAGYAEPERSPSAVSETDGIACLALFQSQRTAEPAPDGIRLPDRTHRSRARRFVIDRLPVVAPHLDRVGKHPVFCMIIYIRRVAGAAERYHRQVYTVVQVGRIVKTGERISYVHGIFHIFAPDAHRFAVHDLGLGGDVQTILPADRKSAERGAVLRVEFSRRIFELDVNRTVFRLFAEIRRGKVVFVHFVDFTQNDARRAFSHGDLYQRMRRRLVLKGTVIPRQRYVVDRDLHQIVPVLAPGRTQAFQKERNGLSGVIVLLLIDMEIRAVERLFVFPPVHAPIFHHRGKGFGIKIGGLLIAHIVFPLIP